MAEHAFHRSIRSTRSADEFDEISIEFLQALRGTQSQKAMSRRLGFSSNVYHQWEAGRRAPALTDVMKAASFVDRSEYGEKMAKNLQSSEGRCTMITEMTIGQSLSQLSESLSVSRSALSRWRSGSSVPTFAKFLRLVDVSTGRLIEFLNMFVDPAEIESVSEDWKWTTDFRVLVNVMPVCVPTLCALNLDDYKALPAHDNRWLGKRLGICEEEMRLVLSRIEEVGAIKFDGTHFVSSRDSYDLFSAAPDLWSKLGLESLTKGYYTGTASQTAMDKIRLETQNFLLRLQQIVDSEEDEGEKNQIPLISVRIARLDRDIE